MAPILKVSLSDFQPREEKSEEEYFVKQELSCWLKSIPSILHTRKRGTTQFPNWPNYIALHFELFLVPASLSPPIWARPRSFGPGN